MTMSDAAVILENVSKTYKLHKKPLLHVMDRLALGFLIAPSNKPQIFQALKNINLSIMAGERIALIGENGAGKTTLLKLLIGHIKPTSGRVSLKGTVQGMMGGGMGFHPSFTGMENIHAALAYNGLSEERREEAIADIIEFTELGDYLGQPCQNYSLGMRARLEFAISSAIRPDILIIDEMLGAGDGYFIIKSARRMQKLVDQGCTLILVSHNTQQVLQFCERAVWLRHGEIYNDGDVREVVNSYDVYIEKKTHHHYQGKMNVQDDAMPDSFKEKLKDGKEIFRWPGGQRGVKIDALDFVVDGVSAQKAVTGGSAEIHFSLIAEESGDYVCRYLVTIWTRKGRRIARIENHDDHFTLETSAHRTMRIELSPLLLSPGDYTISFSVYNMKNNNSTFGGYTARYDVLAHALDFTVEGDHLSTSLFQLPAKWHNDKKLEF